MFIPIKSAYCAAALFCCVFHPSAFAQTVVQAPARPDPTNAASPVPALTYVSPFTGLPRLTNGSESKPMTWREANDNVARIGGWRVYAREAQAADAAPAPGPAPASAPAPAATHQHAKP